ncbi:autophagy-related protein 16 [Lipomyces tetrasporus]
MAADWRSAMVHAIDADRDVREKKNYYIIDTCTKLAERASAAEANPAGSMTGSRELARLRSELESLYNHHNTSQSKIENLEAETEKLKHYNARIVAEFEKLQLEKKRLETRLKNRDEEYRERNKSVQILQDEILTYQIQLNVAEDNVNKLEKENRELVNRWMERVSREAEKLNDANAFLESIDRNRQRNREPKQEISASATSPTDDKEIS